ncbi:HNH endonuclease signature motif containing protein [Paenibacillus mucilaginosus]|nr:HNH endonuclease signature motif containing protein [Paenibacillus caseinilyticus]
MPNLLPTFCREPGCRTLTRNGRCPQHQKQQDRGRGSAASRGYDAKWRKARTRYLQEHPLCQSCMEQGRLTVATVVDHIKPHKGDMQLFWRKSNWQALCKSCHDKKTAREDGGFGN